MSSQADSACATPHQHAYPDTDLINTHSLVNYTDMKFSPQVLSVFETFLRDTTLFALIYHLADQLQPLHVVNKQHDDYRRNLSDLGRTLHLELPTYIIIRIKNTLVMVTFAPWRAPTAGHFIHNRHRLLRRLGDEHFTFTMICRDHVEVVDHRSWYERMKLCEEYDSKGLKTKIIKDVGYFRTKCRMCDRRMKNDITQAATDAFSSLGDPGALLQICLDPGLMQTLIHKDFSNYVKPEEVVSAWTDDYPSFTFYRHPDTYLLYFVFYCPDVASVQLRMRHTMAIPGLVNVIAQEQNVHVDQKLEVHDKEDLVFEARDERIGKYRSMYLRNGFDGTESQYANAKQDEAFYRSVTVPDRALHQPA